MVVISISITEASEQIVSGFPVTISLSTNVPATIFYTTDGSIPTTFSSIFTSPIVLPTNSLSWTLQTFATNGIDTSPIITHTYTTNILNNTRIPHAASVSSTSDNQFSLYPFGTNSPSPNFAYTNSANAGITVDNTALPIVSYGFDVNGNPVGSNKQIDTYQDIYSTTNVENQALNNVGNLPGKVTVIGRRSALEYTPESSSRSSGLFNAKAMVIFQDSSTDDPSNPVQINPQSFSMENLEIVKDGILLQTGELDTQTNMGAFIKSYYNPRTQNITSYYRDAGTNRWIISTYPYAPKDPTQGDLSGMVHAKQDQGVGRVFQWNQFRYRTLT